MGCSTCSSSAGCGKPNGGGCSGSCNKKSVFNWLNDLSISNNTFDIVEVKFKSGRKEYCRNKKALSLITGDFVVIDEKKGNQHIGIVSLQGELVRLQLKKKKISAENGFLEIIRVATEKDLELFEKAKSKELKTLYRAREIIQELKLKMKLSDVEFQADNGKATFYYSAVERVDFRELIKCYASEFNVRVEMKQISLRQEAARLGGIGSCGRELCCSTWIHEFKKINTSAARYQQLSLNQAMLSGQCGRLKCCLNYELDTYVSELKDIPKVKGKLQTKSGYGKLEKTDIFKKIMFFSVEGKHDFIELPTSRVKHILELNKKGVKPFSLLEDKVSQTKRK